jgi:hypothetical protein
MENLMPDSLESIACPEIPEEAHETGELAAALKNRQIAVRLQIIVAFQRLGTLYDRWPDFVRSFYENPQERAGFSELIEPPPFRIPTFDRLKESPKRWLKSVEADVHQHLTSFLEECQYCVTTAEDEEIPPAKSARGAGRKGRNASTDRRFEWAARRLRGDGWKEMSDNSCTEDQVAKSASQVLDLAGWPPK